MVSLLFLLHRMRPLQKYAIFYFDVILGLSLYDGVIFSHFSTNEQGIITLNGQSACKT